MPYRNLAQQINTSPTRIFWIFALTHLVIWTLVSSLVSANLPLDVVEGYAWGNEWLIGTHKHPPMQAWILEILYTLTGKGRWAPYLASQIAIVTAFWAVWRTGRRIAGETAGLVGALLLEGIVYYNFTSPEFNPNVLQLPFWALAGWSFYKGVKEDKIIDWMLLGVWAAAGLYTKYSSGLFLLALVGAMLAHRDGRRRFASVGPYLSLLTAGLLFLPHMMWLIDNHFIPLQYAEGRLEFEHNASHYSAAITTLLMVAGQILALLGALVLFITLYDRRQAPDRKPVASFDRIFLIFAAFGPFLVMFTVSLVLGYHVRDMWETPFWNFLGLWAVVFLRPSLLSQDLHRFALSWIVIFVAALFLFVANETLSPYVTSKPKRTNFPGKHLSGVVVNYWHDRYHKPLKYVVGGVWPAGNVAWYADDRPHVLLEGNASISPWIDMKALRQEGGVVVWCMHCSGRPDISPPPAFMHDMFPSAEIQEPLVLKRVTFANIPPAMIGWAIIPPSN